MKKLIVLAAAAAGLLALSAPAQGKEIITMKVCGASGCATSTDPKVLSGWEAGGNQDPPQVWQVNPAGYYKVDIGYGYQGKLIHSDSVYWLPGRNLMRGIDQYQGTWWKLYAPQVKMLRAVTGSLTPYTPTLNRARVHGKAVAAPTSYLRLLGKLHSAYLSVTASRKHRVRIVLHTDVSNPWIHRKIGLWYRPKTRILVRGDGSFRVPKGIAKRVMRRMSLADATTAARPAPARGDSTALLAGIGAAGLAGGLGLVFVGRRGVFRKARDS
jgi:hypothetical protein